MKPMLLPKTTIPKQLPACSSSSSSSSDVVTRLAKLINSTPISSLDTLHRHQILPHLPSCPQLLPSLLSRLLSSHSSSPKSLRLLLLSLPHLPSTSPHLPPSLDSALHSLSRARLFSSVDSLLQTLPPSLLSPQSLSIVLSRHAKFHPFDSTLDYFHRLDHLFASRNAPFGVDHFNALLRAFSSLGRMPDARAAFNRLHSRFPPNSRTLNTLLLGFKLSGNLLAFDLFYNDMVVRGFEPDVVTYNIRIDAYCKKRRFDEAVRVLEEMEGRGFEPTVRTMTTLIHGAGIARNPFRARRVFDEITERGLEVDRGAYNALMGAIVRVGDLKGGVEIMDEMERKEIGVDDVSYYTLFCGMKKAGDFDGVREVYRKMKERDYVPRVRTVMLLMKYFCEKRRSDLGLEMWDYLVDKGCCPHRHALDLLVIGLCCSGKVEEAFECFKQVVERGRSPSERSFMVLEGALGKLKEMEKVEEMKKMMESVEGIRESQSMDYDEEESVSDCK